jgi:O-antigen ligase
MPITPYFINSILLISWAALLLASALFAPPAGCRPIAKRMPVFFLFSGIFLFFLIGMTYTVNLNEGWKMITVVLPMVLLPYGLVLCTEPGGETEKKILATSMQIFFVSTFLLTLWTFFWLAVNGVQTGEASHLPFGMALRVRAAAITARDTDYLGFYLAFAVYVAASGFIHTRRMVWRLGYVLGILLMLAFLMLLAVRSPIIGLAAGCCIVLFLQLKPGFMRWAVPLGLILALGLVVRFTPPFYERVREMIDTPLKAPVGDNANATNLRVGIFKCTRTLISEHWLIGIGPGGDRTLLPLCYDQFHTDAYKKVFYNTHDTYLNYWLIGGLPSFLLFLALMVYGFRSAWRRKDMPQLYLMILMGICFLTENILTRQAGVVFFFFFLSLMEAARNGRNVQRAG